MTGSSRRRAKGSTGRRRLVRALLLAALGVAIFLLGVALGQVTESTPASGPEKTEIRTIEPVAATTVTVTVTTTVTTEP